MGLNEIICSEGVRYIENLHSCNYDRYCDQKMQYGYGTYCRHELMKAKGETYERNIKK